MCDNNSSVQMNHRHRTPDGHLARAWERNGRIRGRAPAQFVARGCGPQNASPLVPRRACAAVRPAQAHRTGVAAGLTVFPGAGRPTATSASVGHPHGQRVARGRICHARSPGADMPRPLPQRHQGGWGVAPSHLQAARGLRAAEARPKATPRIHNVMQMSMKTGFYLFSKFLKI